MTIISFEYLESSGKTDYFSVRVKSGGFVVKMKAKITPSSTDVDLPPEIETASETAYIRLIEAVKAKYLKWH